MCPTRRHPLVPWGVALLILAAPDPLPAQTSAGAWTLNGVAVEAESARDALLARPIADGAGGLYVAWRAQATGGTTSEVRCAHLLPDGQLDPAWPAGGLVVGGYPGLLAAASDGRGGVFVLFGTATARRVQRLAPSGAPATGWTSTGMPIGDRWLFDMLATADGTVWGLFGRVILNCPVGHDFCESLVVVGARRVTVGGVDVSGTFNESHFAAHAADVFVAGVAANSATGIGVLYEVGVVGLGYQRFVARNPVGGSRQFSEVNPGPAQDFNMHIGMDSGGSIYFSEGYFETARFRRSGSTPGWPAPWTYPPGPYDGAYALDVIGNADGSALTHSMTYMADPSPRIVDSFVQRVLPNGVTDPAWPILGLSTRGPALLYQSERTLVPDGRGGCLVTWEDSRTGEPDIYVLPIEGSGRLTPGWLLSGTAICRLPDSRQSSPRATHDMLGNLFVVWLDERSGARDLYAQKIAPDRPVSVTVQGGTARWSGAVVALEWRLGSALPAALEVERSVAGGDWQSLGALTDSPGRDTWVFRDDAPVRGAHHRYRLAERAGAWRGGDLELQVPGVPSLAWGGLHPNPASRQFDFVLVVPDAGEVELRLTDLQGRTAVQRREAVDAGANTLRLGSLEQLAPGVYWLRATHSSGRLQRRVVITR